MKLLVAALIVAGAIIMGAHMVTVVLDEVCPTVEEGTEFLSASSGVPPTERLL